ncbi:plastocyanin/azurin family copper-binding protein [Salsipaludibacter albus]|uniref:plastocyanin/azurin family copper-binding protein n=1 Tax=Salsipaludibacter albus TaxID=2849650 RepID=UPI001EE4E8B0|nr:plastocyanin/azurin family copper-binding protein [Salsipaludibacter albus]MBY5164417.1 cupredoxin domain-containing protein [Salsipaludibacter albus]
MRALTSGSSVRARVPVRLLLSTVLVLGGVLTACGGGDAAPASLPTDVDAAVLATDAFDYEPAELEVPAGTIELGILCEQSLPHNIVVETEAEDVLVAECGGGESATGEVELEAGEYTFFCSITGHREAGMEGTLTVG